MLKDLILVKAAYSRQGPNSHRAAEVIGGIKSVRRSVARFIHRAVASPIGGWVRRSPGQEH